MNEPQQERLVKALLDVIDALREQVTDLQTALHACLEAKAQMHCPAPPEPPQAQAVPEKTGLDLLFDDSPMYRHSCSKDKKHPVRSNRIANGQTCNVCKAPMNSTLVKRRKKR